jgi:hypothetical protein
MARSVLRNRGTMGPFETVKCTVQENSNDLVVFISDYLESFRNRAIPSASFKMFLLFSKAINSVRVLRNS